MCFSSGDDFAYGDVEDPTDLRPRATFPPTHPNLPDTGFLLGVKSLCLALEQTWDAEKLRRQVDPSADQLESLAVDHNFWQRVLPEGIVEEAEGHGWVGL